MTNYRGALNGEACAEAYLVWSEYTTGHLGVSYSAWETTVAALVAYQKHLDSVAPAKTTTRMMIVPSHGPTATIEIVVDGKWQPGWGMLLRTGDRLVVSYLDNRMVTVDLERPCDVAMTPADRDFFVSG